MTTQQQTLLDVEWTPSTSEFERVSAEVKKLGHPYANAFPFMGYAGVVDIARSMRKIGFIPERAVLMHGGLILDGRNRYAAALLAGVEPVTLAFVGEDEEAIDRVWAENAERRMMSSGQRSMAVAKLIAFRDEARAKAPRSTRGKTAAKAAEAAGVSPRLVEHATKVHRKAVPELVEAVTDGDIPVTIASDLADASPETQREVVEQTRANDPQAEQTVKRVRAERTAKAKADKAAKAPAPEPELPLPPADVTLSSVRAYVRRARAPGADRPSAALVIAHPPWSGSSALTAADIAEDLAAAFELAAENAYLLVSVAPDHVEDWCEAVSERKVYAEDPWRWKYATAFPDGIITPAGPHSSFEGDHELVFVYTRGRVQTASAERDVVQRYAPKGSTVLALYEPQPGEAWKRGRVCVVVDAREAT